MSAIRNPASPTPPLKWAGGKRWLAETLLPRWQPFAHCRYVEPFCGGLALPLAFRPQQALLCDINPHLIHFYRQLQQGLTLPDTFENSKNYYYNARDRFNTLIQENQAHIPEAAALFYYLNRTGYNGLCRFNQSGLFNVPFGRYKTIRYGLDVEGLSRAIADWQFETLDFEALCTLPDDFIYADPPYDVPFVSYARQGFTWEDQVRLAQWLARHPGPVVASNQATERILALYESVGFETMTLPAPRRIACTGDRRPALEMLATRNV